MIRITRATGWGLLWLAYAASAFASPLTTAATAPEPAPLVLVSIGGGLLFLGAFRRRKS